MNKKKHEKEKNGLTLFRDTFISEFNKSRSRCEMM